MLEFFSEKSGISERDETIEDLLKSVLSSSTLKDLVYKRYLEGNRFCGWTSDGSKGYTDVSTGDIWIGHTGLKTEAFTLGYECMNSSNRNIYRKIGIKYAFKKTNPSNREEFAREILGIEAKAMYIKCKLALELNRKDLVKEDYLKIYEDLTIDNEKKVEFLKEKIIKKGVVYGGKKPAYEFYKQERYDDIIGYYREQISKGKIS